MSTLVEPTAAIRVWLLSSDTNAKA
jgi:hypothetical protein